MAVALLVLGVTYLLIALQRLPHTPVKKPAGSLLGAVLMVVTGVLTIKQAFSLLPLEILFFLFGMLVISVFLQAGNTVGFFAEKALRLADSPVKLLWATITIAALVSALCLNMTAAILLTPVVIAVCARVNEDPEPYIIALIFGVNLGSAATAIGSPQTMLVVSLAGIGFWEYTEKMALISLAGVALSGLWLTFALRHRILGRSFRDAAEDIVPQPLNFTGVSSLVVLGAVVVALIAGAPFALAALAGAAVLLAINPQPPKDVLSCVNWPLVISLGALFVVVGAAAESGAAAWAAKTLLNDIELGFGQVAGVVAVGGALSALFSNVPAAMLLQPIIQELENPKLLWFALALATTFAGNITLFGSLSNMAVVEICDAKERKIKYLNFLKLGLPVSIVTLAAGLVYLARG